MDSLPVSPWGWIPKLLMTRTHVVIGKSGLDGYFLLRYLRMMIILFGGSMLLIWPVLLPINAVGQRGTAGGVSGMDILSISNIKTPSRYWAHVAMAIAFVSTIPRRMKLIVVATCYLIYHELNSFVRIRQDNLTSEDHKYTVRATTILVTSVPENFLNVKTLRQAFSVFPGGVKNVFLNRDCSELLETVEERDKIAKKLESAETDLIVMANKAVRKAKAKKEKEAKKNPVPEEVKIVTGVTGVDGDVQEALDSVQDAANFEYLVDKYVPKKKRPTHRLPLAKWMPGLPLIGKKVSTTLYLSDIGRYCQMVSRN